MKFTGYYDSNGKKIYIGDFVKGELEGVEGIVEFDDGEYVFDGGFELSNYTVTIVK